MSLTISLILRSQIADEIRSRRANGTLLDLDGVLFAQLITLIDS